MISASLGFSRDIFLCSFSACLYTASMPWTHTSELIHLNWLFAFSLGRENKLSLAELFALFGEDAYRDHTDEIATFSLPYDDTDINAIFRNIGWSIRVMRVLSETEEKKFPTDVIQAIGKPEGKYTFALWVYGGEYKLSDIGLRIKKTLMDSGISVRLVNTENKNIVSASYKKERLAKSKSEYNLIHVKGISYLAVTIACQDIDAYTKRDTGKSRDMVVGMMPPKLCQMMLNLALPNSTGLRLKVESWKLQKQEDSNLINLQPYKPATIYDPFCGLGTILIEAANMGITTLYGSDLSSRMVSATEKSLEEFVKEELIWQERIKAAGWTPSKDFSTFASEIFELDASKISKNTLPKNINIRENTNIVSEWYLGEIMGRESITLDRVKTERAKLRNMYEGFFGGLCALDFSGNIVMTFPFWDIHGTSSFFTEIYDVIGRHGFDVIPLLPIDSMRTLMTSKWSLLYKRPGQSVGREVIKIRKR
jgi:tRNA G10  N-methylase Trm11